MLMDMMEFVMIWDISEQQKTQKKEKRQTTSEDDPRLVTILGLRRVCHA